MDAIDEPRRGVAAVHVEGLPRDGERAPHGIDHEPTDADGHVMLAVQVKARAPGTEMGPGEVTMTFWVLRRGTHGRTFVIGPNQGERPFSCSGRRCPQGEA